MITKEDILISIKKSIAKKVDDKIQHDDSLKNLTGKGFIYNKQVMFNKFYFIINALIIFFMFIMLNKQMNMFNCIFILIMAFVFNIMLSLTPKKLALEIIKRKISTKIYFEENIDDELLAKIEEFCKNQNLTNNFHEYIINKGKTYQSIIEFFIINNYLEKQFFRI